MVGIPTEYTMLSLRCPAKNYHWGKKGMSSAVARLIKNWQKIDENEHYAELWMGTHPSGPSIVSDTGLVDYEVCLQMPLLKLFKELPEYVGTMDVIARFGYDLPFLFKVLSIAEPLSVQTHPDKALAKRIHAESPDKYPDDNHKPEMAIALSPFEALCSFRPHVEIERFLKEISEFAQVVGEKATNAFIAADSSHKKEALVECFTHLMNADKGLIASNLKSLADRIKKVADYPTQRAFEKLYKFYPEDVGCFCLFFLNYIELKPGEALFLGANEPHCYISGDCIECMAKSDNVIRAGLTPKFKDVPRLVSSLSYESKSVSQVILQSTRVDKVTSTYKSPVEEFSVDVLQVGPDSPRPMPYLLAAKESGSILIILSGDLVVGGRTMSAGSVYFVPAMLPIPLLFIDNEVLCYRAYAALKR